jgi:HAD superfamily hydrolase (TIGR01509 family)
MKSLVIFDCDGVLVDSETLENEIVAQCLTQVGYPLSGPQARARYIGLTMRALMDMVEADMGKRLPQNWLADFHAKSHARLRTEITAIEGVEGAIDALEAMGLQTAVASSGEHAKMAITLGRTRLLQRFEGRIFSAQDVAKGKPAPDVYLHAARALGHAPETCFAVEDSPNGVRAGVAAGMYVFGYAAQIEPQKLIDAGAHEVFTDMRDLPPRARQVMGQGS